MPNPVQALLDWLEDDSERYIYEEIPQLWTKSDGDHTRTDWVEALIASDHIVADDPATRGKPYRAQCWAKENRDY